MLDAKTYSNTDLINLAKENFVNLKINAESENGQKLFDEFKGTGYPLIVFLDSNGNELDRFYGYKPPYEFSIKMKNILDGKNTFTYFLTEFEKGNHSSEILKPLADKYREKGEDDIALSLYLQLLNEGNIAKDDFVESKYYIATLSLKQNNIKLINDFLIDFQDTDLFENAVYELIYHYQKNKQIDEELSTYQKYLINLYNSPQFLNSYAWRMTELNQNLDDALDKVNLSLSLLNQDDQAYPMVLDTKAEVLWKLEKTNEAIQIINQALLIDSENQYYKAQKEKFENSK